MNIYKRFGAMLDCSRNAVLNISAVKRLIDGLAKMGYNTLELYTEDTFEVEGEPYFGYLRGRYSGAEIKEIDAYASAH
ncbi:MAG: beta-N-acetylhexosaminidase, partial [Clostridia bacterium]|nr:beta-N-acetylhexosaminidase [Clostridia bacterium]